MNSCTTNGEQDDRVGAYSRRNKLWTTKEETILADLVMSDSSRNWKTIAERMSEMMGNGYQYKAKKLYARWTNHADPCLKKSPWSIDEDILLLELVTTIGDKWSEISKCIIGRTRHIVRNRYKSLMRIESDDLQLLAELKGLEQAYMAVEKDPAATLSSTSLMSVGDVVYSLRSAASILLKETGSSGKRYADFETSSRSNEIIPKKRTQQEAFSPEGIIFLNENP